MLVKRYSSDISWSVGSLYVQDNFIWKLDSVCKDYEENHNIKYVYGSIPCALTGGCTPPRTATIENAKSIIDEYNNHGISCRLAFTKKNVSVEDMKDGIAVELLSHLKEKSVGNINNGVVISDKNFASHVKKEYGLEIISSSLMGLLYNEEDSIDYYNSLFDYFDIVRVRPLKILLWGAKDNGKDLDKLLNHDRIEISVNNRDCLDSNLMSEYYNYIDEICYKSYKEEDVSGLIEEVYKVIDRIDVEKLKRPLSGNILSQYDIDFLLYKGFKRFCVEGRDFGMVSFIRDIGDYIFNSNYFLNVASSILGELV